jgi:hypothetical protein
MYTTNLITEMKKPSEVPSAAEAIRNLTEFLRIPEVRNTATAKEVENLIHQLGKLPRNMSLPQKFHSEYFGFIV